MHFSTNLKNLLLGAGVVTAIGGGAVGALAFADDEARVDATTAGLSTTTTTTTTVVVDEPAATDLSLIVDDQASGRPRPAVADPADPDIRTPNTPPDLEGDAAAAPPADEAPAEEAPATAVEDHQPAETESSGSDSEGLGVEVPDVGVGLDRGEIGDLLHGSDDANPDEAEAEGDDELDIPEDLGDRIAYAACRSEVEQLLARAEMFDLGSFRLRMVWNASYNRITAAYETDDDAVAAADDMCDLQDRIEAAIGGVELLIP